jgi:hypothetical protein
MGGMLGRLPRKFNPRVPHLSALLAGRRRALAPPPVSCDYTVALPADLGMMGNNSLGDCTCAALGHALQVWTANANPPIDTEPDSNIIELYSEACGYKAGDASTDRGGDEQSVLTFAMLSGIPVTSGRHRISAFVEVDPSNFADVKLAIYDGGLCYLGFNVPDWIMSEQVWDVRPGTANIIGGHAVIAAGYDADGLNIISWGSKAYRMTWAFWSAYVDEAYLLADADWILATGKSPAGLSLTDLETQMSAIREAA